MALPEIINECVNALRMINLVEVFREGFEVPHLEWLSQYYGKVLHPDIVDLPCREGVFEEVKEVAKRIGELDGCETEINYFWINGGYSRDIKGSCPDTEHDVDYILENQLGVRIYLNAVINHIPDICEYLVNSTVNDSVAFEFKAHHLETDFKGQLDKIVIYTEGTNVQQVSDVIREIPEDWLQEKTQGITFRFHKGCGMFIGSGKKFVQYSFHEKFDNLFRQIGIKEDDKSLYSSIKQLLFPHLHFRVNLENNPLYEEYV